MPATEMTTEPVVTQPTVPAVETTTEDNNSEITTEGAPPLKTTTMAATTDGTQFISLMDGSSNLILSLTDFFQ